MDNLQLREIWAKKYADVDRTLARMKEVKAAATAFNANIDAVVKISGKRLGELVEKNGLSWEDLNDAGELKLRKGTDVLRGVFKCFSRGIAEEWLTEDKAVYDWMVENIGYDRLQMGGQGGIVANALAAAGVSKVYAHTNSLPKLQAGQFLKLKNLVSFDENGKEKQACLIDRKKDVPLIHWILEFDKGDKLIIDGHEVVCPKSNRFIATYDPLNLNLVKDNAFVRFSETHPIDYIILSGFHALTSNNRGCELIEGVLPLVKSWKKLNPQGIVHLEIASTQDIAVRSDIVNKIAPLVDSIGLNERETIDALQVIGEEKFAAECEANTDSAHMLEAIYRIKKETCCPRVQLHMFGLYMTLQDKEFRIKPQENLRGMCLAAVAAAGKASLGKVEKPEDFVVRKDTPVNDEALNVLKKAAAYAEDEKLEEDGIADFRGYDLIAIPTILVPKPVTLVGMGDTISSISLVASR